MEMIRFRNDSKQERAFATAVRERVHSFFRENKLSTKGNFTLYFKSVIMLSTYLLPFVVILTVPLHPLAALGMVVLMGIGAAGVGMSVMHDGAHGAYSTKRNINKLAASTMALLGSNRFNWKVQHNVSHHTFTNVFNYDPDISTKAVIRLCEHAPLKKYHRYQQYYAFPLYGLMTLMRLFGEIITLIQYNKKGITREQNASPIMEVLKMILIKVVYLSLIIGLPLLFTDFSIGQIILGFVVMNIVSGMIMGTVFQMAHVVEGVYQPLPDQNLVIPAEWLVHQLKATSDFGRKNGLFSWYIGGLDFQIEHHLFPNISHVHYPAIAPLVEATAKEFGFGYNIKPTVIHALTSHFRRLKELGREQGSTNR